MRGMTSTAVPGVTLMAGAGLVILMVLVLLVGLVSLPMGAAVVHATVLVHPLPLMIWPCIYHSLAEARLENPARSPQNKY